MTALTDRPRPVPEANRLPPSRTTHARYLGAEGLRAYPADGVLAVPDGATFAAEMTEAWFGGLLLRRASLSPHRLLGGGRIPSGSQDVLTLLTVQSGELLMAPQGRARIRLVAGDAAFVSRIRPTVFLATAPLVIVMSSTTETSLPATLRGFDPLPLGPLPHTPLVDGVIELLTSLAERLDDPMTFDAGYAERGLIDLQVAVLAGLEGMQPAQDGPERVRAAAQAYIEQNIGDRALDPASIARALGVSVRYLHRVFVGHETTVTRTIRDRRLELVAEALRTAPRRPPLAMLADRFGMVSQEGLARAFRLHFGMSMTEYRAEWHR